MLDMSALAANDATGLVAMKFFFDEELESVLNDFLLESESDVSEACALKLMNSNRSM